MSKSKGYLRFYNRLDAFLTDCETAEAFFLNREDIKGTGSYIFDKISKPAFSKLTNRTNSEGSRTIVSSHVRRTVLVSFIKEMYEEVTEYFKYILKQGAENGADSLRIVGEHSVNFKANDILSKKSFEDIVEMVISHIFQSLENERSTINLLTKVNNKLGLGVDEALINDALPYLELRHVYVHSDGKPSVEFKAKYPFFRKDSKKRIELDINQARQAFDKVNNLLHSYDQRMIGKNFFKADEIVG